MPKSYRIAIVGGGFAGQAAALALITLPQAEVTLFAPPAAPDDDSGRATAIARGPRAMLEVLGIWPRVAPEAGIVNTMKIGDGRPEDGVIPPLLTFGEDEAEKGPLAHIVPNHVLLAALQEGVEESAAILDQRVVADMQLDARQARLTLEDGAQAAFDLVVAADGGRSRLRSLAGIKAVSWPYRQMGLVARITHTAPHEGVAYQNFLPGGPLATLPLAAPNQSSLVWTAATADHEARVRDKTALRNDLAAVFPGLLGDVEALEGVRAHPLHFLLARDFARGRLVLVGDAAHSIHPLAGQGLNLGFKDVAALSQAIADSLALGLDPVLNRALETYSRARRFEVTSFVFACDALNRLFRLDNTPLRMVRDLGLSAVDRWPGWKRGFGREAEMGSKHLRLIRGEPLLG